MTNLKRLMELDLNTAKAIKGGAVGNGDCSCSCSCGEGQTEGNTSWQMMSTSVDVNSKK
jgi:hypothetical protein